MSDRDSTDREFRQFRQGAAAVALRLAGASYGDVAEALSIASAELARTMVESELGNRGLDRTDRDKLRAEESARLLRLLRGVWAKATSPDHPEHLPAAKVALAIIDRHVRLHGLDAPAEVMIHTPTTAEIDAWVAEVMATSVAPLRELAAVIDDG